MQVKPIERPNPKQIEFFRARNRFIAYGGARGGGKTWALRRKALLLAVKYPGIRILILRRTYPELRENHILPMTAECAGIATYRDADKSMMFPGGSRVKYGYLDSEGDLLQYQGQEYDVIMIDEATQIPYEWYITLTACLRGANAFPKRIYLTCNPGGVGHGWVKRLFIDREFSPTENPDDYLFIQAKATDNTALVDQDPGYLAMLDNLPEDIRRAWRDGDWDVFAGQYFTEWRRDVHVIKPFAIPADWRRYVALDYGLDMLAAYWFAVDNQGRAVIYREFCEGMDLGDWHRGLKTTEAIQAIRDHTPSGEKIYSYIAPPDLWNRKSDTGKSTAEWFADAGIYLDRAQNNRAMGWMELKEWLTPYEGEDGQMTANLRVFERCANLIKWLPALQYDPKDPNDCAREPHAITHGPDAVRYFVAGRPRPARQPKPKPHYNFSIEKPRPRADGYGEKVKVI